MTDPSPAVDERAGPLILLCHENPTRSFQAALRAELADLEWP
jgi:hypothetical protein